MNKESIQIKFDGQSHQIDSNTLINTLIHYNTIINVSNELLGKGDRKVSVKINAIEKGSFVIDIQLIDFSVIQSLFSSENISYLADLAGVVGGTYALFHKFKGRPVKETTEINIDNNNIIIDNRTINIYNTQIIREAISKSIETVSEDPAVDGINIGNEKGSFVHFERNEFKELVYTDFADEAILPEERRIVNDATLGIVKLSFEKGKTWEFLYNGFKISIVVKDDALMKLIDGGARFAKGDSIKVKLEILQRFNTDYNAYENKGYRIIEFVEHILAPTQSKMQFK